MTDADIYRKAAEWVCVGIFNPCGFAILGATENFKLACKLNVIFSEYFDPNWIGYDKEAQEQRVLALLLMAAISDNP